MEYRVEILGGGLKAAKPEELEALLNQVSDEGWRLSELSYKPNSNQLWVILERRAPGETSRHRHKSWLSDWS